MRPWVGLEGLCASVSDCSVLVQDSLGRTNDSRSRTGRFCDSRDLDTQPVQAFPNDANVMFGHTSTAQ